MEGVVFDPRFGRGKSDIILGKKERKPGSLKAERKEETSRERGRVAWSTSLSGGISCFKGNL